MRTISLRLPDDLLAELTRAAKARRITTSSLMRECLRKGTLRPSRSSLLLRRRTGILPVRSGGLPKRLLDQVTI
jgi:hypothetical protein